VTPFARAVFLVLAILVAEPALAADHCPLPGQKEMLLVKMYFGQSMPGGQTISARGWDRFLAATVTPRFPDGFTVYDAQGQWTDPVTRNLARDVRKAIADIAHTYRKTFRQQSVGIVTEVSCGAF
jgi:Protein of unknown function (DUF3574)